MHTSVVARRPWADGFPDIVIHTAIETRDDHPAYRAAKGGDSDAALDLALDLIDGAAVGRLAAIVGKRSAFLLPVVADETTGFNAIPDAMAQLLSRGLNMEAISGEVVQANKVNHTRARAFQRLVTPAIFDGRIRSGANYVLVDDHVGLGGTLANLRAHVEAQGGLAIGMTTLTESREARRIALRTDSLNMLREKHGKSLDTLWRNQFGYGIDSLTEVEALILCRQPSVAAIKDFLAQAAIEARGRGLEPAVKG